MSITNLNDLRRMMDISTVKTNVTFNEVKQMIEIVKKHQCICASPMPAFTKYTVDELKDYPDIVTTGVVGFPAGGETTFIKSATTKELISLGCEEIDMVINVSALKSGMYEYVENDIKAVVDAANGYPVKAILEICYLSDDEIKRASEIGVNAGATYIKTGTGWGTKPTTVETIKLIKSTIGNSAKIKAAGGIQTLDIMLEMLNEGCDRFGIGVRSASTIFEEIANRIRSNE
ncbi:deoxyribose-phosphate aldolase [Vagococcus fluvialis]|uniref:deoxyribose-phosphate aldolase n=1 Tax=Vagococcus fluvialis TaxID=2738 RepID=UPI00288CDEE1|nr:deoxyribose-phosphate aldolase [Vagococcus fluvialis]MDT2782990.1 deoxyribose-phosphate aldolase [Vagococcus fluvialis]